MRCQEILDGESNHSIYFGYMEKTLINIKTDRMLKQDAQKVAKELGLPLGTIVNAYLRELVREKRIVFSVPPTPNMRTQQLLKKITMDIKKKTNAKGPFADEEAREYLDNL